MGTNEFNAGDEFNISVERSDDESGDIIVTIIANGDKITINAGRFSDDAYQLHDELADATKQALDIRDNWENRPDDEDGYAFADRDGYYAKLSGEQAGPFPSQDIATYELAHMMATAGYYPNSWLEGERGGYNAITDLDRFLDDGKIKPLPGAKYDAGDVVLMPAEDWKTWAVDGDYGDMGVMVHTYGDPSVTLLATHAQLQPYDDEDGQDDDPRDDAANYQDGPCGDH